jgi:hypothetical protein
MSQRFLELCNALSSDLSKLGPSASAAPEQAIFVMEFGGWLSRLFSWRGFKKEVSCLEVFLHQVYQRNSPTRSFDILMTEYPLRLLSLTLSKTNIFIVTSLHWPSRNNKMVCIPSQDILLEVCTDNTRNLIPNASAGASVPIPSFPVVPFYSWQYSSPSRTSSLTP